jgi:transcriptional regulator with XRE-family HTH domain
VTVKDNVLTDTATPAGLEAITDAVAQHVRAMRQARGWSLDELAGRSGVSKGMLVQIEAARTNPSVGTLVRIADAFGVTVTRLLEAPSVQPVRVTAAAAAPVLWRGDLGGIGRVLSGINDPALVELWEWRLEPGDRHDSANHPPGTRELLHVLSGQVVVTVNAKDHLVREGETVEFLADKAHSYRTDAMVRARLIMVVVTPSVPAEPPARPAGSRQP